MSSARWMAKATYTAGLRPRLCATTPRCARLQPVPSGELDRSPVELPCGFGKRSLRLRALQLLKQDIPELVLHGLADVQLQAQQPFHGAALWLLVNEHRHHVSIDDVH